MSELFILVSFDQFVWKTNHRILLRIKRDSYKDKKGSYNIGTEYIDIWEKLTMDEAGNTRKENTRVK